MATTRGAEETRFEAADERAALLDIAMLIVREAPADAVFAAVAEQAAGRLGTEASAVLRYLGDERAVVVGVWRKGGSRGFPVNAELDFDSRNSATGRVRQTGRPSRADGYDARAGDLPLLMQAVALQSSVVAPVMVGDEVWGALVVSTEREEPLPPGSEDRLGDLAELAGWAVARTHARHRAAVSRQRIVEAADRARRRLERDLHEGIQQHLLALTLKLRHARSHGDPSSKIAGLLDDALEEAMTANTALRELARDLYPIVLSERGLAAALMGVAARAPMPVHLRELPRRRFPPVAEATAYFVVSETIEAAGEHLAPGDVAVIVADRGELLVVELRHERIGDAKAALRDLAERVAAVGGRLHHDGQVLRAEIPVER
jgi:signal transduction histidine kinase